MRNIKIVNIVLKNLAIVLLIVSCNKQENQRKLVQLDTNSATTEKISNNPQKIILYEDSINSIVLPFYDAEIFKILQEKLNSYIVTKEIGEQDGPNFPLYSVKNDSEELLYFSMDSEDTLKLTDIYIKSALVEDMYGLKVGDSVKTIYNKREKDLKIFTNYHQHTYLYKNDSNIMYEVSGKIYLNENVDMGNIQLTEEQIKDWTIELIIWRKEKNVE